MLLAAAEDISRDLLQYGEGPTAEWMLSCSDEEFIRVLGVADWLLYDAPRSPSGASMMIAKACALAAVYVREGVPRDLARAHRMKVDDVGVPASRRFPNHARQEALGRHHGVGDDARRFWGGQG